MPQRRTPRGGPGGSRRPGERAAPARSRVSTSTSGSLPAVGAGRSGRPGRSGRRRPRLTGRAAVLVLVLAVLAVSYASSLRAYLQQREHISDLKAEIAARSANIDDLEREKRRWNDPAYVQAQARERFGYLMPGETSYVVLDEDGRPLEGDAELPTPSAALEPEPVAWWDRAWESVELAGNPPRHAPPPAEKIKAPPEQSDPEKTEDSTP
ncbi:septum formation initiator family protein [Nocardioides sp. GCM10027113]|uniref:FtsB family cell division protein n=1 Tax=unclassified Nocardioides TaxID=2615069 RepID=UPI00361E2F93